MKNMTKIPAKLEQMEAILDMFDTILEQNSASGKTLYQVRVSVEEIFTNIVSYAYEDSDGEIEIAYELTKHGDEKELCISLRDWGKPYNPLEYPDPDFDIPFDERRIGGLGIYMVKKLMDRVEYRNENGCNIITIGKKW